MSKLAATIITGLIIATGVSACGNDAHVSGRVQNDAQKINMPDQFETVAVTVRPAPRQPRLREQPRRPVRHPHGMHPMSRPEVPEGYVARFEHRRWVVLETIVTIDGTDYPVWSQPTLMNRHEWTRLREFDAPFTKTHVLPHGGETHCRLYLQGEIISEREVEDDNGDTKTIVEREPDELVVHAVTSCTYEDSYNKAIGRLITLGASVKSLARSQAVLEGAVEVEVT
jgi:hypothetical protein